LTFWQFTRAAAIEAVRDYFAPLRWLWRTIRK
jgi:hypothetical protein